MSVSGSSTAVHMTMNNSMGALVFFVCVALLGCGADAAKFLTYNCTPGEKAPDYGEKAINNHSLTCNVPINEHCDGCSLWDGAINTRCRQPAQQERCQKLHYVYMGSSTKDHVILVPTVATRGIEDIMDNDFKAANTTKEMWSYFWKDSTVTNTTGSSGHDGFPDSHGALVINAPWYREYHQMHIHAGTRTDAFESCVRHMNFSYHWKLLRCTNLITGGGASRADLYYRTQVGLSSVWDTYRDGMFNAGIDQSPGIKQLASKKAWRYHVGLIVTRSDVVDPKPVLHSDQYFVILYAPVALNDALGRGHFVK